MLPFRLDRPIARERVTLRAIRPSDFDDVHAYMSRPDVARWLLEDAYTQADSEASHPRCCQLTQLTTDGDLALVAIEHGGRVIGHLDVTAKDFEAGVVEVGWRIHPDAGGQGLATEAATALLDVVLGDLGARRVIASLDPRNGASARLCERLGMRREAHHVQDMFVKGEWTDTWVYAILAAEWTEQRG